MYCFKNPHPEGKLVRDCVKRAISLALGRPYKDVALALNRHKKVTGAAKFNSNDNWRSYLVAEGLTYIPFPAAAGEPRMNGERFSEQHPKGRFVLRMAKHLVACVDGVILDTWDCSQKCVYGAYRVPQ